MKIQSLGPINKVQYPFVAQKLSELGETWCDGDSFLEYNPFDRIPSLSKGVFYLHKDNGWSIGLNEDGAISVESFLK